MKFIYLILLFLTTTVSSNTISIVTNDDNPPFSFTLPDQTLTGLYVEFWQLWAQHNQQDINLYVETFEDSLKDVKYKSAIHSGIFKNKQRQEWAHFSLPIHSVETGILLNRKYNKSTQLRDLSHVKVAIQTESHLTSILKQNYKNIEIEYFSDPEIVFNRLLSNEIDAIVAEIPFIKAQLSKLELNGVLILSDEILMSNQIHAMVAKKNQALIEIINKGILNIPISEIIALEKKWLPNSQPFFSNEKQISFLTKEENKWLKTHTNFSLGIDTSWYPFDFTDKKGNFSGIAADYIKYISNTLGINFSPAYERKWTESFELFKHGKIDVMSGVIATDERRKTIDFTQTYFKAPTVIVTKKDAFYVGDIKDLFGKKLGLVKGFAVVELVKNDYPEIQIELVNSIVEGLESLQNNKIDAYLGTLAVVNYEIDKHDFNDIKIATFAPYKFEISMAVRKGLEPLISILNKSFDNMSEKQKASIANNWLAVHISTGTNLTTILKWGLPIVTFLLLVIIVISRYNKKLQLQIQQRQQAEKELQHLASHDALTGLPNWRKFENNFKKIIEQEYEKSKAILFLDLDEFKNVNDNFGHATGDAVLIETAHRLKMCIKSKGILARIGGDEFIVFLFNVKDQQQVQNICASIIKTISIPFNIKESQISIGTSIGISIYPDQSENLNTLVQMADDAMYIAKESGKNTYHFS